MVGRLTLFSLLALSVIAGSLAGLTLVFSADLPQIHDLERYNPSTTTELLDVKGRVIGSFALEHREVVNYDDFAPVLRQAVISIEDKNFESHWGVNVFRVAGALVHDLRSKGRAQGASTLTMQLARNLFLSNERTAGRKLQEAYLAIQIERAFTKQQIFTLYGNQIYLGHGQYGFEAAAEYYFGKHAKEVNLTEAAMLAGLPKGPSAFSPLLNPDKCIRRRNLVLTEMESDHAITHEQAEQARSAPLGVHIAQPDSSVAPWFQEEVRRELEKRFGSDQVHEAGLKVQTTLDLDLQRVANQAVMDGLAAYERRKGWKGRLENTLLGGIKLEDYRHPDWAMKAAPGDYVHALVMRVAPNQVFAKIGSGEVVIEAADWAWTGQQKADAFLHPGDIIYVHLGDQMEGSARHATLEQDSGVQGALMAIDNTTGDVLAMVGGRDWALSQFNRATQAERQTGSSFKPYVYTAAIEDGAKPEDTIVDGPVSFGGYTPHNYENDYKGSMSLISAFAESRNIPAIKLAARVGIRKVIDLVHRFGVTSQIPAYLPVALGAAEITLEEQVASYAIFPNDGVRVRPRLVRKVTNADGIALWEDTPAVNEVISQDTARTMMTMLRAVIAHGTGGAASQLNHPLGGKTGTTSDYTDAWFLGFSPTVTCGVWVGYDSRESLGEKETGARVALPIWITWMKAAIASRDGEQFSSDQAIALNGPADKNTVAKNQLGAAQAPPASIGRPSVPAVKTVATTAQLASTAKPAQTGSSSGSKLAFQPAHPAAAGLVKPALPASKPATPGTKSAVKPAIPPTHPFAAPHRP
jgi:penicillin-binding protein 1A